jgi:predicted NUDIX family NTP pyrophosphohydrolase
MPRRSAGLLMYRFGPAGIEVLLVHPGGPFWSKKDDGAWSIPKGELGEGEDALAAARREFHEETGTFADGAAIALGEVRQKAGKLITGFAVSGNLDAERIRSNTFEIEWPPRSGRRATFPEVDRVGWFSPEAAKQKINPAQHPFIDRLLAKLARSDNGDG